LRWPNLFSHLTLTLTLSPVEAALEPVGAEWAEGARALYIYLSIYLSISLSLSLSIYIYIYIYVLLMLGCDLSPVVAALEPVGAKWAEGARQQLLLVDELLPPKNGRGR